MTTKFTASKTLVVPPEIQASQFTRADIRFHELEHSGATYEGRIFLNNPSADENTAATPDTGYAGSFYVFGHGRCYGSAGHCDVPLTRRAYDLRPLHPLAPIEINIKITDAFKRALKTGNSVHVTLVAIVKSTPQESEPGGVLKFKSFDIVTYSTPEANSV